MQQQDHQKPKAQAAETARARTARRGASRRDVLKLGALTGAALPLILTLAPTEARAQSSGDGS